MLGQFIARAIADHILPMSFLDCYKGKVDCDHARLARIPKKKAKLLAPLIGSIVKKSPLAAPMFYFALFKYDLCDHVDFWLPSPHSSVVSLFLKYKYSPICMRVCFCRVALDRAAVLLRMKREIVRLDNVWGVGGGQRPVKHLIKEVKSQQMAPSSDIRISQFGQTD